MKVLVELKINIQIYILCDFKGKLLVKNIIDYEIEHNEKYLSFFSLGVDSTSTIINNIDKNLILVLEL